MDDRLAEQVIAVRRFNRFYTNVIGLLDETLDHSPFTLTEARVLFELARREASSAADIARDLRLDPAYLTRILKRCQDDGLVESRRNPADGRAKLLKLTEKGRAAFAELQAGTTEAIRALIAPLPEARRDALVRSMRAVETALTGPDDRPEVVIRQHRPGDVGWVVQRQTLLYEREYGWDGSYEALAAQIGADFLNNFKPGREGAWIAEMGSEPVGAVFLVEAGEDTGKLRLLHVEPAARGLGIGRRLVERCIAEARAAGYRRLVLWTNDVLKSACRLYQAAGFELVEEEPHHSFGKDLVGQSWERAL